MDKAKKVNTTRGHANRANGAESNGGQRRGSAAKAAPKKELSANEATLRAWKKTYENRRRTEKASAGAK